MNMLENQVAIVTGASSGIGAAAARCFAKEGAQVVLAARREDALRTIADEITAAGGTVRLLAGDVADEAYARALVELATRAFGGLDIAFNNAGTLGPLAPTSEVTGADWRRCIDVNLGSGFYAAKHQAPAIAKRGGGSIIFTSTFVGYTAGMPNMAAYAASKAGLIGLTRTLAVEFAPARVRVNALIPGGVDTPMGRAVANTDEALRQVESLHALGRIARPEEIAQSALFLASAASSFTTGSALVVDGGVSVQRG